MNPTPIPAEELVGSWQFRRIVDDRIRGREFYAIGTADFRSVNAQKLHWLETGFLVVDAQAIPIRRHLLITRSEDSLGWSVTFMNGKSFHPLSHGALMYHRCGSDLYRGWLSFSTSGLWSLLWHAVGPTKEFTSTTLYSRCVPVVG